MTETKDLIYAAASLAAMEETHAYLINGRSLAHLTTEQLRERWLAVMRQLAGDPTSGDLWKCESDVRHEAELRGAPLSEEFMSTALERVIERIQVVASDVLNDPAKRLALRQKLQERLADVPEQINTSTKN